MSDLPHKALLPAGFHDVLPPDAAHEAAVMERLLAFLSRHGYDRVKPPLVEFEETLLQPGGGDLSEETFRLQDPISQRMMALRTDMTLQVARIAGSRLRRTPRPLRLCYAGPVLRVRGTQLTPERQLDQVGAELIGASAGAKPEADAEVITLAAGALRAVGIDRLSLDLNVPPMVPALFDAFGLEEERRVALHHALDRKDAARVAELAGPTAPILNRLLAIAGRADTALAAARDLAVPEPVQRFLDRLIRVTELVTSADPALPVTVDFVEHRGFEYHRGVAFTLFAPGVRGELGRGGRYHTSPVSELGEPATGMTLYVDTVLRAVPPAPATRRIFVPLGTDAAIAEGLRQSGWVTLAGLIAVDDAVAEAARMGCSHVLLAGEPHPVAEERNS